MNKQNANRGRVSAIALTLSVLAGTIGATNAQARLAYEAPYASSPARVVQDQNVGSKPVQDRWQDAGQYECTPSELHTHLQRRACGG